MSAHLSMNETQPTKRGDGDDLRWDVFLVVTFHSILLSLLFLLLWFSVPLVWALLGDFRTLLPWFLYQLIPCGFVRHPLLCLVVVLPLLWGDARLYRCLCMTHGKKAGTLYAMAVGGIVLLAILWFGFLFSLSLNSIAERQQLWRSKQRTEHSAAPLSRDTQTGPPESEP